MWPMSKPAGRCRFCRERGNLTKGHIWPGWVETILPPTAPRYTLEIGKFHTFVPRVKVPAYERRVKPGHAASRKPRNTCGKCNSGWMSRIEDATRPALTLIILGRSILLDTINQRLLASFLCLASMRLELGNSD